MQDQETKELTDLVDDITENLAEVDGEYLANVAARILAKQVSYLGNDRFEVDGEDGAETAARDFSGLIEDIREVLSGSLDGEWVAAEYAKIMAKEVRYVGDSLFDVSEK